MDLAKSSANLKVSSLRSRGPKAGRACAGPGSETRTEDTFRLANDQRNRWSNEGFHNSLRKHLAIYSGWLQGSQNNSWHEGKSAVFSQILLKGIDAVRLIS